MGDADSALNYQNFMYLYSAFFEKLCLINLQIRKFCCIFALVLGAKNKEPRIKTYYLKSLQKNKPKSP